MDNPLANLSQAQKVAVVFGSLAVGGYMVVSHHRKTGSWNPFNNSGSSTSAATATTSTTTIDPVTGLTVSQDDAVDPVTGMTYLAEAQAYGSVQAAESAFQFGTTVGTGGTPPSVGTGTGNTPTGTGSPTSPYTSNAAWAQAVQAGLTDIGYDPQTVADALGLYLTAQPMTSAQAQIIATAIAEFGPAPIGNLQIITQPDKKPATTVTVPDVKGKSVEEADAAIKAAGLTPGTGSHEKGTVTAQSPGPGAQVAPRARVNLTVGKQPTENTVTVPNVVGKHLVDAQEAITDAGLRSTFSGPSFHTGEVRTVTSQNPKAGEKVAKDTNIKLVYKITK